MNPSVNYHQQQFSQSPMALPLATYHSALGRLYPHWHSRLEFFYVRSGRAVIQMDLDEYAIGPGDVVVASPRQLHGGRGEGDELCRCEVAVFSLELLRGPLTDDLCLKYVEPLRQQEGIFEPVIRANDPGAAQLRALVDELIALNELQPPAYELSAKAAALKLCAVLYGEGYFRPRGSAPSRELHSLKKTLSYINDHLADPLTLDTLCATAQYSKYHFLRTFKRHMGMTTTEYITALRLERAAQLLRDTDLPVAEICAQTGFGNVSYFIKRFRENYGYTPLHFRKKEPGT